MRWTNVATTILKGAAQSKPLREVELVTPWDSLPLHKVVDEVRKANPSCDWLTAGGESASHDIA